MAFSPFTQKGVWSNQPEITAWGRCQDGWRVTCLEEEEHDLQHKASHATADTLWPADLRPILSSFLLTHRPRVWLLTPEQWVIIRYYSAGTVTPNITTPCSREHISSAAQILCDLLAELEMSDSAAEPIKPTTNVIQVSHSWQGVGCRGNNTRQHEPRHLRQEGCVYL